MDCLTLSRHLTIPWCPVCILSSISSLRADGILLPLMIIPSLTDSSVVWVARHDPTQRLL